MRGSEKVARGKKTETEQIYKIIAVWAITGSYAETARRLDINEKTVEGIVKANKDKPEFAELLVEKRKEFSVAATRIIDKALCRLESEIDNTEKDIPINHLTTVIGTLYDKRALCDGEPTDRVSIIGSDKLEMMARLAGYEKKQ